MVLVMYIPQLGVGLCMFVMLPFSNFDVEAALIFQEAIAERRAGQRIAFSPPFPPFRALGVRVTPVGLFLYPRFVSFTPSPRPRSTARIVRLHLQS